MISKIFHHVLTLVFKIIPLQLFGMVYLAIVIPFIPRESEKIPLLDRIYGNNRIGGYPLTEVHKVLGITKEQDWRDGITGDPFFRTKMSVQNKYTCPLLKLWFSRYIWSAMRNPLNNYKNNILAFKYPTKPERIRLQGNYSVSDGEGGVAGYYYTIVDDKWEYYRIIPYTLFGERLCVRIRLGWKIGTPRENRPGDLVSWCFVFSPFKAYKGS